MVDLKIVTQLLQFVSDLNLAIPDIKSIPTEKGTYNAPFYSPKLYFQGFKIFSTPLQREKILG